MKPKVVILGGGVAGMSAAHELCERDFDVSVYELKSIPGGKARSMAVPDSSVDGNSALPGEHGFRFFPRFYRHIYDTMKRIPYERGTVYDNLVDTTRMAMVRFGLPPIVGIARFPHSLEDLKTCFAEFADLGVPKAELDFFGERMWQIMTSCKERRLDQYEKLGWWDFIEAERMSQAYQTILGYGATRALVAARANLASTKTIGNIGVQLLFDIAEPGMSSDRVLNGPTNDVWINPWLDHLRSRGVDYHLDSRVVSINCEQGTITGATIEGEQGTFEVTGDYYIAAMPVDVMAKQITEPMLQADPTLANIQKLSANVEWMTGMQYYLTDDVPVVHGHTNYLDSPWALTSISQHQFWLHCNLDTCGDGFVHGVLSVDVSDWNSKGLNGKTAMECTKEEIKMEVWEQIKRSVNNGSDTLQDSHLHSWFLDPDIVVFDDLNDPEPGHKNNKEPLLVNLINTWNLRPDAYTRIPNLFLASDYIHTYTDLATMEGANEAARRVVNCIIDASGSHADLCQLWELHEPDVLIPWRMHDRDRYKNGLPWDGKLLRL